jgi:hypothetical protein
MNLSSSWVDGGADAHVQLKCGNARDTSRSQQRGGAYHLIVGQTKRGVVQTAPLLHSCRQVAWDDGGASSCDG